MTIGNLNKMNNDDKFNTRAFNRSFVTLKENIQFASIDKAIKSITVLSSQKNEGKSIIALNLASVIAKSGQNCLLVDADFYSWNLSRTLGINSKAGIYNLVSGRTHIFNTITQTRIQNLYFLDSEPNIPNPSEVLSSKRFSSLVNFLYGRFDYIIFYVPPVNNNIDGIVVGGLSDGVIISVRENYSEKKNLIQTINKLEQSNINILGTVLTYSKDSNYNLSYESINKNNNQSSRHERANTPDSNLNLPNVSNAQIQNNLNVWLNSDKAQQTNSSISSNDGQHIIE